MPHQINTRFTSPRIAERESAQAGAGLPAPRTALGPATALPARGGPNGAAEVRTLRELCHDLTMPATSIRLLVTAATRESDPDPALRARLRQIADEAGRIADICGHFLSGPGFGNGESGQASLGLAIVAALVRRNNGGLHMGTSDLGGLAVAVTLPLAGYAR